MGLLLAGFFVSSTLLLSNNSKKKLGGDSNPDVILLSSDPTVIKPGMLPWQNIKQDVSFAELPLQLEQEPVDCDKEACLALTFDDGPDKPSTAMILDALAKENAKASFFLVGNRSVNEPGLIRRMYAAGHDIGNHSWAHPFLTKIPSDHVEQQVTMGQQAIKAAGVPEPSLFRPPYGALNDAVITKIQMPIILWNVDPHDWHEKDPNAVVGLVVTQAKPGAIVLLHDRSVTAKALEQIVPNLKQHFRLVTVTQLLKLNKSSRGVYYAQTPQ